MGNETLYGAPLYSNSFWNAYLFISPDNAALAIEKLKFESTRNATSGLITTNTLFDM